MLARRVAGPCGSRETHEAPPRAWVPGARPDATPPAWVGMSTAPRTRVGGRSMRGESCAPRLHAELAPRQRRSCALPQHPNARVWARGGEVDVVHHAQRRARFARPRELKRIRGSHRPHGRRRKRCRRFHVKRRGRCRPRRRDLSSREWVPSRRVRRGVTAKLVRRGERIRANTTGPGLCGGHAQRVERLAWSPWWLDDPGGRVGVNKVVPGGPDRAEARTAGWRAGRVGGAG